MKNPPLSGTSSITYCNNQVPPGFGLFNKNVFVVCGTTVIKRLCYDIQINELSTKNKLKSYCRHIKKARIIGCH